MSALALTYYHVFTACIQKYHFNNDVNASVSTPYDCGPFKDLLFKKCWIDTVQWHLEDMIREPAIDPVKALSIKRRIDKLNQERTNTVEMIDDYFLNKYNRISLKEDARHSTESIGWAIDRLSILALKIFHVEVEINREDATREHLEKCNARLMVLNQQQSDLVKAIDWLIEDISAGRKIMKVYRQLKMYNEHDFNPVLYKKAVAL